MPKRTAKPIGTWRSASAGLVFLLVQILGGPGVPAAEPSLAGRLLIASPDLTDPNFAGTVIYMVWHDARGSFGVVVNQPMGEVPVAALLGEAKASNAAGDPVLVHYGGPVAPREAFALHSAEILPAGSVELDDKLAFSPGTGALRALTIGTAPEHLLVILGYAGWAPEQLEFEIERGDWFVGPWDEALVFSEDPADSWNQAIARYGPEL
jgi:putative transcriptional regulator